MSNGFRIFPLGDSALTVEFGNEISVELNEQAIALSNYFESHPFPGFIETVPAYASATIFFDVVKVWSTCPQGTSAYDAVQTLVANALTDLGDIKTLESRTVEIPIRFDADAALDLDHVAKVHSLTPDEVIDIFLALTYRVFMLGFLPGFTYMAEVDERIATARKDAPRTSVPKGSVGIAGKQTGIYSLESPGGWQIIGRTDVEMFTPEGEWPTLLSAGDNVTFVRAR